VRRPSKSLLGNVWYARHDLNKAEQYFQESVNVVPAFTDAVYGLGTVLWEKDEVDRALAQFDRIPFHAGALLSRAIIRSGRGQFREAVQDSAQALKLYESGLDEIIKFIDSATRRGLSRRADAQRKKKDRFEMDVKRAQAVKAEAETRVN
jgi:tetratricopeptide (TPR) repeat protein